MHHGVVPRILGEGSERAHDVDAEMLVEAAIFSGERRLDHHVRDFLERNRVVAEQAALADFIAETIEEGDAVFVGQIDLAVCNLEGGEREDQQDNEPASAERQRLAGQLVKSADEALDLEAAEECGVRAPPILEADPKIIEAGIDPGIDRQPIDELAASAAVEIPHRLEPSQASPFPSRPGRRALRRGLQLHSE